MGSPGLSRGAFQQTQAEVRVFLLGCPRLERRSLPLDILRRQVRALFYYLSETLGPESRDRLCYLISPDVAQGLAARRLTHCLTHLRLALGGCQAIAGDSNEVWLDTALVWSDTGALAHDGASGSSQELERLVSLYRGPFLAGFALPASEPFESWLCDRRRAWEQRYLDALAVLVEDRRQRGEWHAAIRFARQYLETDLVCEAMHRQVMELCAHSGDRAAAVRQYERCAALLNQEVGVSPAPETVALLRSLLAS